MDITKALGKKELSFIENKLCNARCDLEELAEMMIREDIEINDETDYDVQDIADNISYLENYIFEFLENEK